MKNLLREMYGSKKTRTLAIMAAMSTLIFTLLDMLMMVFPGRAIDTIGTDDCIKNILLYVVAFGGTILFGFADTVLHRALTNVTYDQAVIKFVDKLISMDYKHYTKYSQGELQAIYASVHSITDFGDYILSLPFQAVTMVVAWAIIGSIAPALVPVIITGALLYGLSTIASYKKMHKLDVQRREIKTEQSKIVSHLIEGFIDVRSASMEAEHAGQFKDVRKRSGVSWNQKSIQKGLLWSKASALSLLMDVAVLGYGMYKAYAGAMSVGDVITLFMYANMSNNPMSQLVTSIERTSETIAEYNKYIALVKLEDNIKDGSISLSSFDSSIRFSNVSFSYEDSDTVLSNLSFSIRKGEKIGICGYSGEGKTTIFKLLQRFYDTDEGSIEIDGIDIRKLTQQSIRSKIGAVHQNAYIFDGTIYDNVSYGCGTVTESEVIEACKKANIYDFIKKQDKGVYTEVGPNGLKLSGGQQQRLAIARVFLKNPDIVLLDEATSALDNESEQIIQDSLKLFKDKTIITVAHRISTIMDSDRILVINNHTITEEGTHGELIERNGIYEQLYMKKK